MRDRAARVGEQRLLQHTELVASRARGRGADPCGDDAAGVAVRPRAAGHRHELGAPEQCRHTRVGGGPLDGAQHQRDRVVGRDRVVDALLHGARADEHR